MTMKIKVHEATNSVNPEEVKKTLTTLISSDAFQNNIDNLITQFASQTTDHVLKTYFDKTTGGVANALNPADDEIIDTAYDQTLKALERYIKSNLYH